MIKVPKTLSGKWSIGFGIAFVLLLLLSLILAAFTSGGFEVLASSPLIMILNLSLNLSGLFSLLIGLFTVIKHKEWSVSVNLLVLYVLALLIFLLGEFLFPR